MKKINILHLKPSELNHNFENPRKCSKEKIEQLKKSLEKFGDHDIIKINEKNEIISGNQRIKAMIELGIDIPVLCKRLIGFTEKELKEINIKSNEHVGEWDFEILNEWQLGIKSNIEDIPIIENENDYFTTTQKSKYLQDNMLIKIGKIEIYIKKEKQPQNFKVFYNERHNEKYNKIIIKGIEKIANEILYLEQKG